MAPYRRARPSRLPSSSPTIPATTTKRYRHWLPISHRRPPGASAGRSTIRPAASGTFHCRHYPGTYSPLLALPKDSHSVSLSLLCLSALSLLYLSALSLSSIFRLYLSFHSLSLLSLIRCCSLSLYLSISLSLYLSLCLYFFPAPPCSRLPLDFPLDLDDLSDARSIRIARCCLSILFDFRFHRFADRPDIEFIIAHLSLPLPQSIRLSIYYVSLIYHSSVHLSDFT